MDYTELVKSLRICSDWGTQVRFPGEPSECDGCSYYDAEKDERKSWDEPWRKEHLLLDAADAIEMLLMVWKSAEADHDKMRNAYIAEYDARIEETKRHCPHYIRNVHDRGDDSLCTNFSCEVSALPRWVPVTERLPDAGERVLCYCRANIYEVMKMRTDGAWVHNDKVYDSTYMGGFVTHWMPLPTPPKEENDGI